jgi:hypothetical protein
MEKRESEKERSEREYRAATDVAGSQACGGRHVDGVVAMNLAQESHHLSQQQ